MPVSFARTTSRPSRRGGGPFGSLALRGALLAALIGGGAVYATTVHLTWAEERRVMDELAPVSEELAAALASQLAPLVLDQNWPQVKRAVAHLGRRNPDNGILTLDFEGRLVTRSGPDFLTAEVDVDHPRPVASGALLGNLGERRIIEHRRMIVTDDGVLGEVRVRGAFPEKVWAGSMPVAIAAAALLSFVVFYVMLRSALRALPTVHHALERTAREEFFHRAEVRGCKEMRELSGRVNDTLQSLSVAAVRVQKAYVDTAKALARTIEAKDRYTSGHNQRVARYSVEMGEWLGFDQERLDTLHLGAILHDIGKVAVPDAVLLKQGPLNDEEFEVMKNHPMAGDRILSVIPGLRDMADIARSHHERWDGKGYPMGVAGEAIPLEGRIVAIADAYDALVTKRCYKPAMPVEKALGIIERDAGSHFDPDLARLFVAMKRNGKGFKAVAAASEEAEWKGNGARSLPSDARAASGS